MDINRFIKDNKDEHGYVELPSINNLISLLARTYCTKKEINDVLSALLSNNNNTIYAVQKLIEQEQRATFCQKRNESHKKAKSVITPNTGIANTTRDTPSDKIDEYFKLIYSSSSNDLSEILFSLGDTKVLDSLLARILLEKVSFYKLAKDYEKDNDMESALLCMNEVANLECLITSIRKFDQIDDSEVDEMEKEENSLNKILYLTAGSKNFPYEDIKDLPRETYPNVRKLLIGLEHNRFNKFKKMADRDMCQVSDGSTIRIYFNKIAAQTILVGGVYIKKVNGFNSLQHDFVDKRIRLMHSSSISNDPAYIKSEHQKVLTLLHPTKRGSGI